MLACVRACVYEFVFGDGGGRVSLGKEEKEKARKASGNVGKERIHTNLPVVTRI